MLVSSSEGRCLDGLVAAILLRAAMIAMAELSLSVEGISCWQCENGAPSSRSSCGLGVQPY